MKFQGLVTPNSLLVHLDGPYCMPLNDLCILTESSLLVTLEQHTIQLGSDEGDPQELLYFQIYGDLAYGVILVMVSLFSDVGELTAEQ